MRREIIHFNQLKIEYLVFGSGKECILCMHGHGRSANDFEFLENKDRKVISINLFHHGNSYFPDSRIEKKPIKIDEFYEMIINILDKENMSSFHCFAFSQGGRFILALLPYLKNQIRSITLLSPDGMDNNSFYNWSSRRKLLRELFISWEEKPQRLRKISDIAVKLRLMRPKVRDFVYKFTSDPQTMKRASKSWRSFRSIMPNTKVIGQTIKEQNIPLLIIMGEFDKIIRPSQAYRFIKKCKLKESVMEIKCGHDFFKKETVNLFKPHLLFNTQ
ncbi:MAG: hypothetical protein CL824_03225 [Crocinitomicaceae bacterium]|nr:hypothetical protein [Crocinitomicaceae bacterium]